MRKGIVKYNGIVAGMISEIDFQQFVFKYTDEYYFDDELPSISVTIPKNKHVHFSKNLFPFFYNILSEGNNRKTQCRILKIDEEDDFGLLLKTGAHETIGAITVEEINGT